MSAVDAGDASPPVRIQLFLKDHRVLEATARVPEGHCLSSYLTSHSRYLNLTDVDWLGTRQKVPHMALRVDKVLWSSSSDPRLAVVSDAGAGELRRVEVELDGGYLLAAGLRLGEGQRLTDYLQTAPSFVPLTDAELLPRAKALGPIVVNHAAVQVVRELGPGGHGSRG